MRPAVQILILALAIGLTGCASTETKSDEDRVSSIPWNRPQSWEGQGPLGSMMQQQQGGRY